MAVSNREFVATDIDDITIDTKRGVDTSKRENEWSFAIRLERIDEDGQLEWDTVRVLADDKPMLIKLLKQLKYWASFDIEMMELEDVRKNG